MFTKRGHEVDVAVTTAMEQNAGAFQRAGTPR
jgi:hypothetical protein